MRQPSLLWLVAIGLLAFGCAPWTDPLSYNPFKCIYPVEPKGSRELGFDISYPASTLPRSLDRAIRLGGQFQVIRLDWNDIEGAGSGTTSGALTDPGDVLAEASQTAVNTGMKVALVIDPISREGNKVPDDLQETRFSAGRMRTRFKSLIDFVLTKLPPGNISVLVVGGELDGYDSHGDADVWTEYGLWLQNVATYLKANYPTLKTAFGASAHSLLSATEELEAGVKSAETFLGYAAYVDVVGVNYDGLGARLALKSPAEIPGDFALLTSRFTNEIHVLKLGYPSSEAAGTNADGQAWFYCEAMKAWDANRARITKVAVDRLNDFDRNEAVRIAAIYGSTAENFIEYLRSLGLVSSDGKSKQAYDILKEELEEREFISD